MPPLAPAPSQSKWRDSRWLAALEFSLVLGLFIADRYHLVPFSKTPFLLLLGWVSLRIRGLRWKDLGLTLHRSWAATLAVGVSSGLAMELMELFVTQPLFARLTGKMPDLSLFQALHHNVKFTLIVLALAWTLAAFGEEMVWRGYLMNRVAELGGSRRVAWIFSLILVNSLFGYAHIYQGITGVLENALDGTLFGLLYLRFGRRLAVPIVAHGVSDTIDVLLLYLGKYPGV